MGNTIEGTSAEIDVVIIGGGPTGLGAAYRLHQHGYQNWLLLDAEKYPGGLAGSVKTPEGFRFDHGFKTLTSRFEYFDKVIEQLNKNANGQVLKLHPRDNYVYVLGRLLKYPLQNNLGGLPIFHRDACVLDLIKAKLASTSHSQKTEPENLDEYFSREWGDSLSDLFFRPYTLKKFAYPTQKLSQSWTSNRIPPVNFGSDFERVLHNEQSDNGWGHDAITNYPSKGGMVGFWRSILKNISSNNVRFKNEIVQLDVESKTLTTKSGLEIRYKSLISSMPLPSILQFSNRDDLSSSLLHTSLYVVCFGLRGITHHKDIAGCIYFPEQNTVFHRACIVSNRDPDSVPQQDVKLPTIRMTNSDLRNGSSEEKAGPYWSLSCEVSGGPLKTIDENSIVDEVIRDACRVGLLRDNDEIVSIHLTELMYGYPIPTLTNNEKVEEALTWLQSKSIWSRGRFGSFKYELDDIDCCFIEGVEAVDNILKGTEEKCYCNKSGVAFPAKLEFPLFETLSLSDSSESFSTVSTPIKLEENVASTDGTTISETDFVVD